MLKVPPFLRHLQIPADVLWRGFKQVANALKDAGFAARLLLYPMQ